MNRATCAALLLAAAAIGCEAGEPAAATAADGARRPQPNVVLITLESLRTDHVGAYGGRSGTRPAEPITPVLDALAVQSVLYARAHSVTSWTLASHASLFTGLYPSAHLTIEPLSRLGDSYTTLAEELRADGYQTAAVVSGPYLRAKYNLTQGFDRVDDSSASALQPRAHSDVTNPAMERGLVRFVEIERDPARPFFLFAYFWDPHFDFLPPSPYDQTFVSEECERVDVHDFDTSKAIHPGISPGQLAFVLSQYDGEIRASDAVLGRFFEILRARNLWDDTLLIVTADHGEEFFDHGEKGHKKNLYDETVHVPLFVKYPRAGLDPSRSDALSIPASGSADARLASLVDVMPTVLDVSGIAIPEPMHGRSLVRPADPARSLLFELLSVWFVQHPGRVVAETERWSGVRRGRHKLLVRERDEAQPELRVFDVEADRQEQRDLAAEQPELRDDLLALLSQQRERAARDGEGFEAGGQAQLDDAEREQLRALGYIRD